jgi:hypothetical protein
LLKRGASYFEIRKNEDGSLDEIVAGDFGWNKTSKKKMRRKLKRRQRGISFHLEQMDDGHWWAGIVLPNGKMIHLNFTARGNIKVSAEEM